MSADPQRIGTDASITDLYDRVRALERRRDAPGVTNDFVECSGSFTLASAAGPPPSFTGIPVTLDGQTPGSEGTYFISTGLIGTYLTIADPGFHQIKAFVHLPQGLTGYISVAGVIGGDATLFTAIADDYVPASFAGAGGGFMVWEQTIEVLDTAVVGTGTEVGVFPEVWQNSGAPQTGTAYIQVVRLS